MSSTKQRAISTLWLALMSKWYITVEHRQTCRCIWLDALFSPTVFLPWEKSIEFVSHLLGKRLRSLARGRIRSTHHVSQRIPCMARGYQATNKNIAFPAAVTRSCEWRHGIKTAWVGCRSRRLYWRKRKTWRETTRRKRKKKCTSGRKRTSSVPSPAYRNTASVQMCCGVRWSHQRSLYAWHRTCNVATSAQSPGAGPWSWSWGRCWACSVWHSRKRRWGRVAQSALGKPRWQSLSGWCQQGSGPTPHIASVWPHLEITKQSLVSTPLQYVNTRQCRPLTCLTKQY